MVKPMSKTPADLPKITAQQLAAEATRPATPTQNPGRRLRCPNCGERSFEWTNELERVVPKAGHVVVLKHLTGFRCLQCKAEAPDLASRIDLAREEAGSLPADYALSLTKQGDRRAIFLNQDLMRVSRPDEIGEVIVSPVDRDHWLVHLVRNRRRAAKKTAQGNQAPAA